MEINTNSPIGCRHWFNTLMGQTLRIGEFLSKETPDEVTLRAWGKKVQDVSRHFISNYDKIIDRSDKLFDPLKLHELFLNIREGNNHGVEKAHYILSADKGDIAEILYFAKNEWKIIIDNFPRQRKFYSTNMPIITIEDFISEMARIDLKIKIRS